MEFLSYIGILTIIAGLGWLGYWLSTQITFRNPIKTYIRKVVLNYLKELQNDIM